MATGFMILVLRTSNLYNIYITSTCAEILLVFVGGKMVRRWSSNCQRLSAASSLFHSDVSSPSRPIAFLQLHSFFMPGLRRTVSDAPSLRLSVSQSLSLPVSPSLRLFVFSPSLRLPVSFCARDGSG